MSWLQLPYITCRHLRVPHCVTWSRFPSAASTCTSYTGVALTVLLPSMRDLTTLNLTEKPPPQQQPGGPFPCPFGPVHGQFRAVCAKQRCLSFHGRLVRLCKGHHTPASTAARNSSVKMGYISAPRRQAAITIRKPKNAGGRSLSCIGLSGTTTWRNKRQRSHATLFIDFPIEATCRLDAHKGVAPVPRRNWQRESYGFPS